MVQVYSPPTSQHRRHLELSSSSHHSNATAHNIDDLTRRRLYSTSWYDDHERNNNNPSRRNSREQHRHHGGETEVLVYDVNSLGKEIGVDGGVSSDEFVEERLGDDDESKTRTTAVVYDRRLVRRRFRAIIVVVLLGSIVILIAVVVVVRRARRESNEEAMTRNAVEEWKRLVASNKWSDPNLLEATTTAGSVQYRAIQWLASEKKKHKKTKRVDTEEQKFRYALTVFFHSVVSDGGEKNNDNNKDRTGLLLLKDKHFCEWNREYSVVAGQQAMTSKKKRVVTVGVVCDENMRVTQLVMPYLSLRGTLPDEIGLLEHLTKIDLTQNKLHGAIPPGLQTLTNLEELRLPHNALQGTLPAWFNQTAALTVLDLSHNPLTGGFPAGLAKTSKLTVLDLSHTESDGDLEDLRDMPSLRALFLGSMARLSGGHRLSNHLLRSWPKLEVLDLSDTGLAGTLPRRLFQMEEMVAVDLSRNGLTGRIPAISYERMGLNRLQFVSLHDNRLTGVLPDGLVQWNELQLLDLHNNNLTGKITANIGFLSELRHLALHDNSFTGELPPTLPDFYNLQSLIVSGNSISSSSPQQVVCDPKDPSKSLLPNLRDFVADCATATCACCTLCCYDNEPDRCTDDTIWTPRSIWDSPYVEENFLKKYADYMVGIWSSEAGEHRRPDPSFFDTDDYNADSEQSGNGATVADSGKTVPSMEDEGTPHEGALDDDYDEDNMIAAGDDSDGNAAAAVDDHVDDKWDDASDTDDVDVPADDVNAGFAEDDPIDVWDDTVAGDPAAIEDDDVP